jgi:hypothetical protein
MFCPKCGNQCNDGITFCPSCGAQLAAPNPVTGGPVNQQTGYTPAPVPYKKHYNAGNFTLWIGCILAAISVFLPYASISLWGYSESISLIDASDGPIFLGIAIVVAVLNLFKVDVLNIIGSVILLIAAIYERANGSELGSLVDYGFGCTLLIIGSFVAVIGAIVGLVMHKNAKKAIG